MSFDIRNLAFIRSIPGFGQKLYEAFQDVRSGVRNTNQQSNTDASGQIQPPPPINALNVTTGPGGEFQIAITDNNTINRGINYWADHDTSPSFTNPHRIDLGQTRNWSGYLGGQKLYWRAASSYQGSDTSPHVVHGGTNPIAVQGGVGGPRAPSMGSGTGAPGSGPLSGPGPVQSRATGGFNFQAQSAQAGKPVAASGSPASVAPAIGGSGGGGFVGGYQVAQIVLYDTYANWTLANYNPANYAVNTLFRITDRNFVGYVVRVVAGANKWVYQEGTYSLVQASIAGTAGFNGVALGTNDAGFLISVTDYNHVLAWSGTAWGWGPGDSGSDYFVRRSSALSGNGWHVCDGTGVNFLKSDGTLGTTTLPNNATTAVELVGSAYVNTITAATNPIFTGNSSGSTTVMAGVGASVAPVFTPSGNITLPGVPVANYEGIGYYRQ